MPILLSTFAIMIDWNIIFSQIATVAFDIIYFGAIIGTIVVVILDNRNPVKTMAWILVLMFLPIVGLVFYFFFGRSQRRERIIGKKSYGRLLKKPMAEYLAQGSSVLPEAYERLIKLFQHTNQALPFEGNRVDTYTSGYSMLQALLRELQKAEKHIHMEFYIFEDDAVGRHAEFIAVPAQQNDAPTLDVRHFGLEIGRHPADVLRILAILLLHNSLAILGHIADGHMIGELLLHAAGHHVVYACGYFDVFSHRSFSFLSNFQLCTFFIHFPESFRISGISRKTLARLLMATVYRKQSTNARFNCTNMQLELAFDLCRQM